MIGVSIRFLTGRFHATPWGRHVNEAAPEWPISPWRLLRAFVATWKRKLDHDTRCSDAVMSRLLSSLSPPPLFAMPPASTGHARHYMPWFKNGPNDKTLVFDAWVAFDRRSVLVCLWPEAVLEETERTALVAVADNMGSLGRAESWIEARVLSDEEASEAETSINCVPSSTALHMRNAETVRVLCVDRDTAYENTYTPKLTKTEGRGKNKQQIITPIYDPDWHLCLETLELHNKKWSDPPGSKWVTYLRPRNCFEVKPTARRRISVKRERPTVARFALDGAVLPLVEDTLKVAEKARIVAMGCFRRVEERRLYGGTAPNESPLPRSDLFSGKDETGKPLKGHKHAFYLPTDEDSDGRIDHLTIIAEAGFGPSEQKALDRMKPLKLDESTTLNLVLMALGQTHALQVDRLLGPSAIWKSATPFISTRHAKTRGSKKDPSDPRDFAGLVLIEEIDRLRERRPEIPVPESIEPLNPEHRSGAHHLRPIQFKRYRQKRGDDGGRRAAGAFKIVFPTPVLGPICLGHSSHFGLGLFVPELEQNK
jgi:CRISPR-associated protein Csb2